MPTEHLHFITGKLAEPLVREIVGKLAAQAGFSYTIQVLNITVAALLTTEWIARRLVVPPETTKLVLPGYCRGELSVIETASGVPVILGPKDIRQLPEQFGQSVGRPESYGRFDIEIIAEINHAPQLSLEELVRAADRLRADGADVIDLGCNPAEVWQGCAEAVYALKERGHRVSIDTFHPAEIAAAAAAGAELVLSVNGTNRAAAAEWGIEVVAVPDDPHTLAGLDETIRHLEAAGVKYRIDPILEPIGFGCFASLVRYHEVRTRYPTAEIMMGIGNLTELTDVDTAGMNVLLLAICQELGVRSVLTTQVINWARSCVRECDLARRLVFHAVEERTLPKRLEPLLVMLRDPKLYPQGPAVLAQLAASIKDRNYRIFAEDDLLHVINAAGHRTGTDPFALFAELAAADPKGIDPSHAFYLGYELAKAVTALTLGKNYRQDQALEWGFLTRPEQSLRDRRLADAAGEESSAASE